MKDGRVLDPSCSSEGHGNGEVEQCLYNSGHHSIYSGIGKCFATVAYLRGVVSEVLSLKTFVVSNKMGGGVS